MGAGGCWLGEKHQDRPELYMIPLIPFGLFYTFSLQHFWQFQLFPFNVTIMLTMYCAVRFILPNESQLLHARANASQNSQVYCTNVSILSCHTCHTINSFFRRSFSIRSGKVKFQIIILCRISVLIIIIISAWIIPRTATATATLQLWNNTIHFEHTCTAHWLPGMG